MVGGDPHHLSPSKAPFPEIPMTLHRLVLATLVALAFGCDDPATSNPMSATDGSQSGADATQDAARPATDSDAADGPLRDSDVSDAASPPVDARTDANVSDAASSPEDTGAQTADTGPQATDAGPQTADADTQPAPADAAVMPPVWPRTRVYVGTVRWSGPPGRVFIYDLTADGTYEPLGLQLAGNLASFLTIDGDAPRLFVADEGGSQWLSYEMDPDDGRLTPVSSSPTPAGPVYVTTDRTGAWLLTASYGAGQVASYALETARQVDLEEVGAQTHSVVISPDNAFAYAASKGADRIRQFTFDVETGSLTALGDVAVEGGAGPRHLVFHPTLEVLYLMNESNGHLVVFDRNRETGLLTQRARHPALPQDFAGRAFGADVHLTPDGRHLFFTMRIEGANGLIGVYDVDPRGALSNPRFQDSRGRTPRNFDIDPTGTFLSVANR